MSWRYLAAAAEAVLAAGGIHRARYGDETVKVDRKGEIDLVTEVDRASEEAILRTLRAHFPRHDVVTEEQVLERRGSRHVWYVDPLDGTTNFAHGYPFFCASVALTEDGVPVAGAIFDAVKQELFTAERGGGAYLNGRRLRVSGRGELLSSLLCTGFPYDLREDLEGNLRLFTRFMGEARAVRRDGAAALDLAYVAAARLDGFWEQRLKPWDLMAGALLVEEAGGRVTRFDGGPLGVSGDEIVAANPALHARMLAVVQRAPVPALS